MPTKSVLEVTGLTGKLKQGEQSPGKCDIMNKFEAGKTYSCVSVCDSECKWTYQVTRRTEKCIWIKDTGKHNSLSEIECRYIPKLDFTGKHETIFPLGRYSMAPILRAESEA